MQFDLRKRHPNDARSKFERWVLEYGGPSKVAVAVGVSHTTVGVWLQRRASPQLGVTKKLLDLARGHLSIEDILEGTTTNG